MALPAALLLLDGCATPAKSRMAAALDYVRAVEDADLAGHGRTVAPEFKYVAPRPGKAGESVELPAEFVESGLRGLASFGSPALSSVRFEEREEQGALDVYFRMEASSRREKLQGSAPAFTLEGRWRLTVAEREGAFKVTRVEEFPTRSDAASFALVKALHAGLRRPLAPGACNPVPCAGQEFLDPSGRVFFREMWRLAPDGGTVPGSQRFVDPEGRPFRNFTPESSTR